ncbi:uncharacterized protein LOC121108846 isoform X1 [Gallus gallus]|uniref:uncharacterized protein LOC121108846 isoform X1 n=1 Tax=Gallus gallus TaxID=9031 RepID=UPI001AE6F7A6|nr:uncharacterized protein LOC121108846 isoform X1 [Gallus gallus]XP_046793753.1 uncharacterized protein LOC121108846 isoform X1 [Gallus gallus]
MAARLRSCWALACRIFSLRMLATSWHSPRVARPSSKMANSWPAPPTFDGHLTGGIGTKKPPAPKSLSPDKHRADGSGAAYRAGTSLKGRRDSQPRRENGRHGSVGPMSADEGRAVPSRGEPSGAEPSRAEPSGGGLGLRECCSERAPSWPAGSLGRRPPGAVAPLSWEKSPARSLRQRYPRGGAVVDEELLGRLMIDGEKCAANLGLTNGFRMAVRYPPSAPSDYRARLCILGGRQLGRPPG